jgi:hypothetical protein
MLKEIFEMFKEDLKQIKKTKFQLPEEKSIEQGVKREIEEKVGRLPETLRDIWILWIYHCHIYRRHDAGIHGRTENEMKRQIILNILDFYLAPYAHRSLFRPSDFWVDREWNLFLLKKEEE